MRRRCVRAATTAIADLPRDLDALRSIAWARWLSTSHVTALHYPSRRVAQRRLRAMFDEGLLRARLQGDAMLHRDNLYSLAAAGERRLVDEGSDPGVAAPGRIPQWRAVPHGIAIRDAFVAFRLAEREGVVALEDFLFEGDLVRSRDFTQLGLIPDALIVAHGSAGERRLAVEVDLGTSPVAVLAAKLEKYHAAVQAGLVHQVFFVLGGARRTLAQVVERSPLAPRVHLVPRDGLGAFLRGRSDLRRARFERSGAGASGPVRPIFRAVQAR